MFIRRKFDKYVIAGLAAGLFAYLSFQPVYRLRTVMPPEFADTPSSLPAPQRAGEERIATAYWNCAVTEIQIQYSYGRQLPLDPPPGFQIAGPSPSNAVEAAAARLRYWRRLRQLWYVPSIWTKVYEWDFSWLTGSVKAAGEWLGEAWRKLSVFL
ncbi:MAG: hypothetical protein LAN71_03175 [Acidobacteriia bacterium]|nr:hypothetical protein [Terriglobia bacterium]